jgi:hypothetical protein
VKAQELKKLIREEVKGALREASNLENRVADLYGYSGVKTQYSDDTIKRYGQKVIDLAIQMAPKILAYEAKLKKIVEEIEKSPEAKMLMSAMGASRAYGGDSYGRASVGDLINRYTK